MKTPRKTIIGSATLGLIVVALGVIGLANQSSTPAHTEAIEVARGDARHIALELAPTTARLELSALPAESLLALAGEVEVQRRETLVQEVAQSEGLELHYRSQQRPGVRFSAVGPTWNLAVARDIPTDLTIRAQVGRTNLDLRDTSVRSLDLSMETGQSRVLLPAHGITGVVATEVGELEIVVPSGANATITVRRGLTVTQASDDFTRTGRQYRLAGSGPDVDLTIENTSGRVRLSTY